MRRPAVDELVDCTEQLLRLGLTDRAVTAEHPGAGVVRQRFEWDSGHADLADVSRTGRIGDCSLMLNPSRPGRFPRSWPASPARQLTAPNSRPQLALTLPAGGWKLSSVSLR